MCDVYFVYCETVTFIPFQSVKRAALAIKYNHCFRQYIDTILTRCPESFVRSLNRQRNDDFVDYNTEGQRDIPSEKNLVRMHLKVIQVISTRVFISLGLGGHFGVVYFCLSASLS